MADGDDHSFLQDALVRGVEVASDVFRLPVQRTTNAVASEILNDLETVRLRSALDGGAYSLFH
jgi:hypothetical protein